MVVLASFALSSTRGILAIRPMHQYEISLHVACKLYSRFQANSVVANICFIFDWPKQCANGSVTSEHIVAE